MLPFVDGCRVRGLLKSGQGVVPDPLEIRLVGGHPIGIQPVDAASAVRRDDDQATVLENPKMLGDRLSRDRKPIGQLTDRKRLPRKKFEYRASPRITEDPEVDASESGHVRKSALSYHPWQVLAGKVEPIRSLLTNSLRV